MPVLTPQDLATASVCLRCVEGGVASQVFTYLLNTWNGGTLTPQDIVTASTPYQAFTGEESAAAATYLLAVINGGTQDPNTLSLDARCFECDDSIAPRVQIYLLASITGSSTDPNALLAASNAFQVIPNYTAAILYLLSLKAGVNVAALQAATPCWRCLPNQPRIQTYLLADIAS